LKEHFPDPGDRLSGYCGAEFKQTPPSHAPVILSDTENIDHSDEITSFYECRGKPIVEDCFFLAKSVWVLPFDTANIKQDEIHDCMQALPMNISVYGNTYELAGYSLHQGNHFTSVMFWNGKSYYYDGLKKHKLRLIPCDVGKKLAKGFRGSHVYYFLIYVYDYLLV